MKNCNVRENQTTRRILLIAYASALAAAFTVTLPPPARARVTPPPVPADIEVPAGNKAFLEGHAVGTQDYVCLPRGSAFAWIFFGQQATLFNDRDRQVITQFVGLNPFEGGIPRSTWQHSRDTSTVWAMMTASSSDPGFVVPGAIPWLRFRVVGAQDGPTGGHKLTATTFIQQLNTSGGVAPATGCALSTDVGGTAFVPYTADYFFYKND